GRRHRHGAVRRPVHCQLRHEEASQPTSIGPEITPLLLAGRRPLASAPVRQVRIHDTLTGGLKLLEPRDAGKVGIYACGPTVYGRIHVGNARPYVVFSLLKRFLEHEGYEVKLVVNITDVNDKIYAAAEERGVPSE